MAFNKCETPKSEPRAGDKVRVQFSGVYSHQGSGSERHFVEVESTLESCTAPPDADIWVLERKPLEPVSSVVVVHEYTGRAWTNDWTSRYPDRWKEITEPKLIIRITWQELLDQTNGGQGLKVFRYESSAELYKGPVRE